MTQNDALTLLKTGRNAFVTGPAGSGKTHVVNAYISYLRDHDVPIGITASTGIAATHVGGMTIHSWAGMGVHNYLSDDMIDELAAKSHVRGKIADAQVLFIDEISMLHHFRLDMVDRIMKKIKKSDAPFGGAQVVLCGDFFQLPPVSRMGEPEPRFAYHADVWKQGNFAICYLESNYRQKDDPLVSILGEMRKGNVTDASRELLVSRGAKLPGSEDEIVIDEAGEAYDPVRLFTHNADVDAINDRELGQVEGVEASYEMTSKGKKPLVEALKKSCLAPEVLRLKKGARVMCVKNNFDKGYVNGTLGTIVSCGFGVDPVIRTVSTKEHPDGRLITIEQASWTIEDDGKVIAEIRQYPLRLAWAITVHKSQGMSLDAVEVDLSKAFEAGMGYVALSRARTLGGLSILGIGESAFRIHPDVRSWDDRFRDMSLKEESMLLHSTVEEITRAHAEFLARVAPLHEMVGGKKKRQKSAKKSTYELTAELILKGKPLRDIATERDMSPETIIAHIETLLQQGRVTMADIAYLKYDISSTHFKKIEAALEKISIESDTDMPLLSPVKTLVGPNISFKDIRLARAILGYVKSKKGD